MGVNLPRRFTLYTAEYDRMRDLLSFLVEDCCAGSPDICSPLAAVVQRACGVSQLPGKS